MPRILIADDNSNIQRMAALALKEAGIEVIAVNNGEAAVRKLAEIMPDLVLADIFMPVRSGYEVCEYVKRDPRYANIPVLLLAGAFDPFDEQEAQRVHADGVLKKPFVPPDPLINAVKTLLAKCAGDRLVAVTVPAAASEPAEMVAQESGKGTAVATRVLAPQIVEEVRDLLPVEFALPSTAPVDFGTHETHDEKSLAPLLEPPTEDADEAEPVVTASRDPILGEPSFWVPADESGEAPTAKEATSQDFTDHTWGSDSRSVSMREDAPLLDLDVPVEARNHDLVSEPISQDIVEEAVAPAAPQAAHELTQELAPELAPQPDHSPASSTDHSADDTLPLLESWRESATVGMTPVAEDSATSGSAAIPAPEPFSSSPAATPEATTPAAAIWPEMFSSVPSAEADATPVLEAPAVSAESVLEQVPTKEEAPAAPELAETLRSWHSTTYASEKPEPAAVEREAATSSSYETVTSQQEASATEVHGTPEQARESVELEQAGRPEEITGAEEITEVKETAEAEEKVEPEQKTELEQKTEAEHEAEPQTFAPEADSEFTIEWPPAFISAMSPSASETRPSGFQIVPATRPASTVNEAEPKSTPSLSPIGIVKGDGDLLKQDALSISAERMEAIVQRVIERMQPQIIEILTRDILHPLVEALVQQELKK